MRTDHPRFRPLRPRL